MVTKLFGLTVIATAALVVYVLAAAQTSGPVARFGFDGGAGGQASSTDGLAGPALRMRAGSASQPLTVDHERVRLGNDNDFSVQFWVRTTTPSDVPTVLLSQKPYPDSSLASQKASGWVFYVSGGTWAWNVGSGGSRRLTYERDNGQRMPLNDGRWHQLTMTHDSARSEVRLYYDGTNRVVYHVDDATGFDFTSASPLVIGWDAAVRAAEDVPTTIQRGAASLQALVDEFNGLGVPAVTPEEFVHLITDPRRLFEQKGGATASVDFSRVTALEAELMRNPYTVHQIVEFMEVAPLLTIYALVDGRVTVLPDGAAAFAARARLHPSEFDMDELAIWDRVLSADEVSRSYAQYATPADAAPSDTVTSLTAAAWNIWHGATHFTTAEHGWDSRIAVADLIRSEGIDVVMMQETYSAGDVIAAELGYYFAESVDWDYLNQGANISVLSRYPITELHVQEDSPFMNIGARLALSGTQDLYAMSNWYGMDQFPAVFDFHAPRFQQSATIPTLFAGDFNAVPHTDGGDSPASRALLDAGFTDAFREAFPDAQTHPGPTHRNGRRIDQLYYKGASLTNASTKVISTRAAGFPSDHFLIVTKFDVAPARR